MLSMTNHKSDKVFINIGNKAFSLPSNIKKVKLCKRGFLHAAFDTPEKADINNEPWSVSTKPILSQENRFPIRITEASNGKDVFLTPSAENPNSTSKPVACTVN